MSALHFWKRMLCMELDVGSLFALWMSSQRLLSPVVSGRSSVGVAVSLSVMSFLPWSFHDVFWLWLSILCISVLFDIHVSGFLSVSIIFEKFGSFLFFFLQWFIYLIYFERLERHRIFYPLVHPPEGCSSWASQASARSDALCHLHCFVQVFSRPR